MSDYHQPQPPFQEPATRSRLDDLLGQSTAQRIAGVDLRYSRVVKRLRLLLPILAAVLAVVVLVVAGPDDVTKPVAIEKLEPQIGKNELVTPRFESQDSDDQPYSVTATRAYQKSEDMNIVELDKPVADMTLKDNTWLALKADKGEFVQDKRQLALSGNVRLFHDQGYELLTDKVDIDIPGQSAVSNMPVRGHGPAGRIRATGFTTTGNGSELHFNGPAKLTLYPQKDTTPVEPIKVSPTNTDSSILTETP